MSLVTKVIHSAYLAAAGPKIYVAGYDDSGIEVRSSDVVAINFTIGLILDTREALFSAAWLYDDAMLAACVQAEIATQGARLVSPFEAELFERSCNSIIVVEDPRLTVTDWGVLSFDGNTYLAGYFIGPMSLAPFVRRISYIDPLHAFAITAPDGKLYALGHQERDFSSVMQEKYSWLWHCSPRPLACSLSEISQHFSSKQVWAPSFSFVRRTHRNLLDHE